MPDSPTSEPESSFVCECEGWMRSACAGEPSYGEHQGKRYCVLHFPLKDKAEAFEKAYQHKLDNQDFDFCGVVFPLPLRFERFNFSAPVRFSGARFLEKVLFEFCKFDEVARFFSSVFESEAGFVSVRFRKNADFTSASFNEKAFFPDVVFEEEADFSYATFTKDSSFGGVTFRDNVDFNSAIFREFAEFSNAFFGNYVRFSANQFAGDLSSLSSLDLQFARIEKPERVSFHTLSLRPHWFVNVDARKFSFINVTWPVLEARSEIEALRTKKGFWKVSAPHRLLAIAAGQLASNAEENDHFEEASRFRYLAMEFRRIEKWRGFSPWRLSWWYWLASGYGERVLRAFLILLGIWLAAGLLYTRVGFASSDPKLTTGGDVVAAKRDDVDAPLRFSRALTYSAGVMTLQKPEPRPATIAAQSVVLLETVLGPVQAALLALAIRRKFMR